LYGQAGDATRAPSSDAARAQAGDATRGQAGDAARAAMDAAAAKQRTAAALMEQSVARQRAALAKQTGQTEAGGFFVLAPPATLGANFPAPAAGAGSANCEPLAASEIDSLVEKSAKNHDVDKDLLRGVMQEESAFRPCAISSKGAMGLMQLMPAAARDLGVDDPFDPAGNVEAGAAFLKQLLVRYNGDLPMTLGAYNAGMGKVDAAAGVPKIPETEEYVKRILARLPAKQ
jgi:soluble lytic murein transglycosylase-like protein